MIGIRQLLVIALLIGGLWLFNRLRRRFQELRQSPHRRSLAHTEPMVRCARCGTHIPKRLAIHDPAGGLVCNDRACADGQSGENQR